MAMETQDIIKRSATNPIPRRARGTTRQKSQAYRCLFLRGL
jgi:hypothetical protein